VHIVAHDGPRMHLQAFFLSAVIERTHDNVPVPFPCEQVYPGYYLECEKIWGMLVFDDIAVWHRRKAQWFKDSCKLQKTAAQAKPCEE